MIDAPSRPKSFVSRLAGRAGLIAATTAVLCASGCDQAGGSAADQDAERPQPISIPGQARTAIIRIGGVEVTAEIADNQELRGQGLMNRDSLAENHGMLFVYGTSEVRSFWMRNTRIPLDIAFIDANGVIINIEAMEPQTDQNYYSQGPMMYALEMDLGWFEANGVGPGDRLEF